MRKQLFIRIWFRKVLRYLCIPLSLVLVMFPLYGLMTRQTIEAQSANAAEMIATGTTQLERCLLNIRSTTNKLFNETEYILLAGSRDDDPLGDYLTAVQAGKSLQDKTYDSSFITYSYITFARNGIILDDRSTFYSHSNFYPSALEYENESLAEWEQQNQSMEAAILPAHIVRLRHSTYGNSYVTIYQPYLNAGGRLRGAMTVLVKEKDIVSMFLSQQQWQEEGLFCLVTDDGTVLAGHNYDGSALPVQGNDTDWGTYQGQRYLMISRSIPSLNASAIIGMSPALYETGLRAVQRAIWLYLLLGILGCILISSWMTLQDLRVMRPILDALNESGIESQKMLNQIILRNLNRQDALSRELERSRSELEHSRMEVLLRTGSVSPESVQKLTHAAGLKPHNFLLLIPLSGENGPQHLQEELRTVVVTEQVHQLYGQKLYVQMTTDNLILVILTLDSDDPDALRQMCRRTEQLHDNLNMTTPLILSSDFQRIEQLSDIYWQARNMAACADATQKICYLGSGTIPRSTSVEAAYAARLQEYLLSGRTEESIALINDLFPMDNLMPENFKQDFYTVCGILLSAAQKVDCPDISHLCHYDPQLTARQMLNQLQDGCVEVCSHVQFLKHSHNEALQKSILNWLAENFRNPELNAAMTAEQFHISKKYLSQFLKEQTGKSYTEYIEELRLNQAMRLLKTSDLSITDISEQCGFSTANTFYKAFRRRYQLSPSAVRKERAPL